MRPARLRVKEAIEKCNPKRRRTLMTVKEVIAHFATHEAVYCAYGAEEDLDLDMPFAEIDHSFHRWFTVATNLYKVEDGFVGIRGPVELKSESMCWRDADYECTAFEMEPVQVTTYRKKAT